MLYKFDTIETKHRKEILDLYMLHMCIIDKGTHTLSNRDTNILYLTVESADKTCFCRLGYILLSN